MREDLIRAICVNPRDDLPRMVYADWLEDTGNSDDYALAVYIRRSLSKREETIYEKGIAPVVFCQSGRVVFEPLRVGPSIRNVSLIMRRGFVHGVACSFKHFDVEWFRTLPIQEVDIGCIRLRQYYHHIDIGRFPESVQATILDYAYDGPYRHTLLPRNHSRRVVVCDETSAIRIVSHAIVNYAREQVGLPCIWKSNKKVPSTESRNEQPMVNSLPNAASLLQDVPLRLSEFQNT